MSREKVKEMLRKRSTKIGSIVLAAAIVFSGSMWALRDSESKVPELVTYVDMDGDVAIEEDETPLAAPTVKTTTKTKKKTKKIKLKKPSTKTYTQKGKTKTKTKKSTKSTAAATIDTKVVETTSVVNKFKKKSKIKTQVTTIKTTTTVTTTPKTTTKTTTTKTTTTAANTAAASSAAMTAAATAPSVDSRVKNAFDKMGFTIKTASGVNYDGLFDARSRTITLNAAKDTSQTVYHELGHFLAFVAGNYDKSGEFQAIFGREQASYTEYNKAYVCSSAAEYFAESFKNYTLNPAALKASRPDTYAAIEKCLAKVTDSQVNLLMSAYSAIWK